MKLFWTAVISDITYQEIVEIGKHSVSFKFIPYKVTIEIRDKEYFFHSYDSIPKGKQMLRIPLKT